MQARYYNPDLGTFLSRDPVMGIMGVSMSMNGYSYVHGNPINLTDPSGQHPVILGVAVGIAGAAVIGGAIGAAFGGGADIAAQLASGTPVSCLDWRSVGQAVKTGAIAGAVAGAVGAATFMGVMAAAPVVTAGAASIAVGMTAAGISSAVAGRAAQIVVNVRTGDPWNQNLLNPGAIGRDFVLGAATFGAVALAGPAFIGGAIGVAMTQSMRGFPAGARAGMRTALSGNPVAGGGSAGAGVADDIIAASDDTLRYNQYWRELDATYNVQAQQAAEEFADSLMSQRPRSQTPVASGVAVSRRDGRTYYGVSGRPYPEPVHPELQNRMNVIGDEALSLGRTEPSFEFWDIPNCAEFQCANQALWDGQEIDDLIFYTVQTRSQTPMHRCDNCVRMYSDATSRSDVG